MTEIYDTLGEFIGAAKEALKGISAHSAESEVRASWYLSSTDRASVGPVQLLVIKDGFVIRNEQDQKTFVFSAILCNQITRRPNGVRFTHKMLPWFVDVEVF